MKHKNHELTTKINDAIQLFRKNEFEKAKCLIHEAMQLDDSDAEVQNLLGAYYEVTGDRLLALRHYRAAYALEPSNRYANMNIERLTYNNLIDGDAMPLFGDEDLSALEKINQIYEKMR